MLLAPNIKNKLGASNIIKKNIINSSFKFGTVLIIISDAKHLPRAKHFNYRGSWWGLHERAYWVGALSISFELVCGSVVVFVWRPSSAQTDQNKRASPRIEPHPNPLRKRCLSLPCSDSVVVRGTLPIYLLYRYLIIIGVRRYC